MVCLLFFLFFVFNPVSTSSLDPNDGPIRIQNPDEIEYVPGELIVKFKPNVVSMPDGMREAGSELISLSPPSIQQINEQNGITSYKRIFRNAEKSDKKEYYYFFGEKREVPDLFDIFLVKFPKDKSVSQVVREFMNDENVVYAEPNYIYHERLEPNDTKYTDGSQWYLNKINASEAWDVATGNESVVIAILDTGVDWDHEDLGDNIWNNTDEISGDATDDDGNGYIDDVRGYDFVNQSAGNTNCYQDQEDCFTEDNDPDDVFGHGTQCAGIAAAVTNNNKGIAGVCWYCKIMPVRIGYTTFSEGSPPVISASYETVDIIQGINYAANNGADVISMSFGGSVYSQALKDAVDNAYSNNITLVAASSNFKYWPDYEYPNGFDNVIAVTGTDKSDGLRYAYGSWMDIAAPSTNLWTTQINDQYTSGSGTSGATPMVAGLVGLLLSKNSSLVPDEIMTLLYNSVDKIDFERYAGLGRINASRALRMNYTTISHLNSSLDFRIFKGELNITGTAKGVNFKNYSVYNGTGIYPTTWSLIDNSTTQVNNGILASWNPGGNVSNIIIRLETCNNKNVCTEDRALLISDYSLADNWPQQIYATAY